MDEDVFDQAIRKTKDRAVELLASTWNCSYSPFMALAEALKLKTTEEFIGASIAFAGGISGNGHICGALWAAIATVSGYVRKKMIEKGKVSKVAKGLDFIKANDEIHGLASEVYKRFTGTFGSPNCKDLNPRFDLTSPQQQRICRKLVRKAVEIALNVLRERYGLEIFDGND